MPWGVRRRQCRAWYPSNESLTEGPSSLTKLTNKNSPLRFTAGVAQAYETKVGYRLKPGVVGALGD